MKPPDDDALLILVRQWLRKADIDYRTAERLMQDTEPIRESIAFHSQQAVEKYIKAYLVYQRIEFSKTHSISRLLDLLSSIDSELAGELQEAEMLTPFGVEIRYPGDFPNVLPGQERTAFALARRTRHSILRLLPPDLL